LFEKAGELCGSMGYEVISKSGEQGSVIGGGQYVFLAEQHTVGIC